MRSRKYKRVFQIFSALILVAFVGTILPQPSFATTTYSDAVLSESSLQGYYRHEDGDGSNTLIDTKNGNNATVSGSVSFQQTGLLSGGEGKSATYDGSSGKATTPNGVFDFERDQNWTIEFLIKPNITRSGPQKEYAVFSNVEPTSPYTGYEVQLVWNGSKTVVRLFMISNFGSANYIDLRGNTDLLNDTVYHVAVTYNGSSDANGVSIYVNGAAETKLVTRNTLSASIISDFSPTIGARQTTYYLPATLDELAVYTSNLSQYVVNNHYRISVGLSPLEPPTPPADPTPPVSVILDTDMASDVDDVGDLAVLNALANNHEANILAVITSSANDYSAPATKAFLEYYGREDIPVGAHKGSTPSGQPASSCYTGTITSEFGTPGDTRANYPDAVTTYREQLAVADDTSVVIVVTGFFQPLQALLQSPSDGISNLTGAQLVAQKAKRLVVVAGVYPSGNEYNFQKDPAAANYVFANWPTEIVSVGIELGNNVYAGPPSTDNPSTNPIKRAFDLCSGMLTNGKRQAWGQLGVLYGVRGLSTYFNALGVDGTTTVDSSTGADSWSQTPNSNHAYLGKVATDSELGNLFDSLLDTTDPTITITSPTDEEVISGTVTVSANGSDDVGIVGVQFKVDNSTIGAEDTIAPYSISWDSTSVSNGSHLLTAVARDAAGNTATSTVIHITTDNDSAPPAISLTALSPNPSTDSNPAITGSATDAVGTVSIVQFQMDGTSGSWSDCKTSDGSFNESTEVFTCTVSSALSDGSHTMYVRAADNNGNTTSNVQAATITFTVDTTAPVAFDLNSPADNAYTANQQPTFRWKTTTDAGSGLSKYQVIVDGNVIIDDINPSDPGSSANHIREDNDKRIRYDGDYIEVYARKDSRKLSEGMRKWKARAIDSASNTRDTEERTLYVDTSAPVMQLDVLGAHSNLAFKSTSHDGAAFTTTDQTPMFEGVADAGTTINVVVESDPIICETEAQDDSSWACTLDEKLPYGRHTVTIKATDKAGNITTLPKLYLIVSPVRLETAIIETETAPKQETAQETAACKTYTVQPGDSLYGVASSQLGDEDQYLDIVEWNKGKYPSLETNRSMIEPGWELILSAACVEEKSDQTKEADEAEVQTYDVKVKVVDTEQQPVKGAKVTLFSTPREAITDENGIATFSGVEKGDHKVVIAYNGQTGEQPIRLKGDMEEFKFTVQIKPSNPFTNLYVIGVVGILVVIIAGLLYLLSRRNR